MTGDASSPSSKHPEDSSLCRIRTSPGGDKEANWLPAANGPVYMLLRLYVPKQTAPSILPAGSGTWKPPAVIQAS